jgi:hypothetical protein
VNFNLKKEIMRVYLKRIEKETNEKQSIWDAFENHMDSIYFAGATDSLAEEAVNFEYENFKKSYAE